MRLHSLLAVVCLLGACMGGDDAAPDAVPDAPAQEGAAAAGDGAGAAPGEGDGAGAALGAGAGAMAGGPQAPPAGDAPMCPAPLAPPDDVDPLCERFNDALCPRLVECAPRHVSLDRYTGPRTVEDCRFHLARECRVPDLHGSALTETSYDACLQRLLSGSCALVLTAARLGMGVCAEPGTLEQGDSCQQEDQCQLSRCYNGACAGPVSDGAGGVLPPYAFSLVRDQDESPDAGETCRNPFLELSDGRCVPTGGDVGEACPCDKLQGLLCMCGDTPCSCDGRSGSDGDCATEGVCQPPPTLAVGDSCGVHDKDIWAVAGDCEEGARCVNVSGGQPDCIVPREAGETCRLTFDRNSECADGLACQLPDGASSEGSCVPCVAAP